MMNRFLHRLPESGRYWIMLLYGAALLTGLPPLVGWTAGELHAEPTRVEQGKIEEQALEAFRNIIGLWQEELYFDLYDFGMETTKTRISREDFAQRMVELSWVPAGELNAKFLKAEFRFRTVVYVSARVRYRHKFNPTGVFTKDHTFMLLEEAGIWHIDLIRLIRAPFA